MARQVPGVVVHYGVLLAQTTSKISQEKGFLADSRNFSGEKRGRRETSSAGSLIKDNFYILKVVRFFQTRVNMNRNLGKHYFTRILSREPNPFKGTEIC